jgi:hypothetical protein
MSQLIQKHDNRATIRWKLLTGASALALTAYVSIPDLAKAEDANRPQIWVELDGQFAQQQNSETLFDPPFLAASPFDAISHLDLEKGPPTIWDKGAEITFQPEASDWVLSLKAHYGKIGRQEVRDGHPAPTGITKYSGKHYMAYQHFAAQSSEGHAILDFQVGKDVGLGRFGSGGNSVLSAGIRFAQFNSRSHVDIKSQPTNLPTVSYAPNKFYASFAAKRRFTGIGPSLSWDASATIAGNASSGSIDLDWGVNGAVLFGRQRSKQSYQTREVIAHAYNRYLVYQTPVTPPTRSKNVTVPNLGGFAAVSWNTSNAKVSIGYRADMFFGAIDGGIDAAKKENRGFYGPFASVSVGIGD